MDKFNALGWLTLPRQKKVWFLAAALFVGVCVFACTQCAPDAIPNAVIFVHRATTEGWHETDQYGGFGVHEGEPDKPYREPVGAEFDEEGHMLGPAR